MTLQQLRLVLESVRTGSISAAAEALGISQPNASLSIKKLEEELGYSVFRRVGGGVAPTPHGYRFIEHAQILLEEDKAIRAIGNEEELSRLRIGVMSVDAAVDAFVLFCSRRRDTVSGDYSCINTYPEAGAAMLTDGRLDVVVSAQLKEMLPLSEKVCLEHRFTMQKIAKLPICVLVRKGHPLVLSSELGQSAKSLKKLSSYPYVYDENLERFMNYYNQSAPVPFGCSRRILTDGRETCLRILRETDAYAVGPQLSQKKLDEYGLASFPTGVEATLVSYTRKSDESLTDISEYLSLLVEEVGKAQ